MDASSPSCAAARSRSRGESSDAASKASPLLLGVGIFHHPAAADAVRLGNRDAGFQKKLGKEGSVISLQSSHLLALHFEGTGSAVFTRSKGWATVP